MYGSYEKIKMIKQGDLCEVISGLGRHKSPNLGKRVTAVECTGTHSHHGLIWRCEGPGIMQLTDGGGYEQTNCAEFAVSWLKKIEPDTPLTDTSKGLEKVS